MMIRLFHIGQWLARSVHYLPYPQLVHIILLELSHQQQAFFYHYRRQKEQPDNSKINVRENKEHLFILSFG